MSDAKLHLGDCLEIMRTLPEKSVQTCVTSPPYFGLRDYGHDGQIGLEETPEAYVAKLVDVFREVRRVLRDDGTLWLNLGDSYANFNHAPGGKSNGYVTNKREAFGNIKPHSGTIPAGCKPKDLIGIPWMVAFALRADGWYLRSDIIWHKPNPMPESVTDRPTKAHEYIFLLSKSKSYYYDSKAIREEASQASMARISQPNFANQTGGPKDYRNGVNPNRSMRQTLENFAKNPGRNRRSVWTVTTKPYKGAHFATFPMDLIEPCILAGTSEKGCCAACGAPWQRVVEREHTTYDGRKSTTPHNSNGAAHSNYSDMQRNVAVITQTIGWQPTCQCDAAVVPCTVIDPFNGSGTTGAVAVKHGRKYIGIELNPDYIELANVRIGKAQPALLEMA